MSTMKSTIDSAGRLVIPSAVRREAGLKPGVPLSVRVRGGVVEIEPEPAEVKLVRKGRLVVAVRREPGPKLSIETVADTTETLRRERVGTR